MPEIIVIPYTYRGQDLTGQRFHKLQILGFVKRTKWPNGTLRYLYKCQCDCGNIKVIEGNEIKKGFHQSCGCIRGVKHGLYGSLLYSVWRHMRERCLSKSCACYERYGGRGITIDPSWDDFAIFQSDMQNGYADGLTLDRKDNNGPYSKENCKWSTQKEQQRNKRSSRWIDFRGKRMLMVEWDEFLNYSRGTTSHRMANGWSIEKTLTTPMMGSTSG